jgi:hypothetical protein
MATLTGRKPKDTYKDLLQVSNSNNGVDGTVRAVEDGEGTASALSISTTVVTVTGTLNAADVNITGGSIAGITDLAVADGGTGASDATAAFDNLSPTTTAGDIIYNDGTNNVRLAVGADGEVLVVSSGLPVWASGHGGAAVAATAAAAERCYKLCQQREHLEDLQHLERMQTLAAVPPCQ